MLDSSPIRLAVRGHEWAEKSCSRAHNQGLKRHLMLTPCDGSLEYASVTDMNVSDICDARAMGLESGRIYVFDTITGGYYDYNWWHEIIENSSHFVTRTKKNAAYKLLEARA